MAKKTEVDKAIETIAAAMNEISSTSTNILAVQRQFNDNFILHRKDMKTGFQQTQKELERVTEAAKAVGDNVVDMRKEFRDWFYPLMGRILTKVVYTCLGIAAAAASVGAGLKLFGAW